jgi:hypothetical protein
MRTGCSIRRSGCRSARLKQATARPNAQCQMQNVVHCAFDIVHFAMENYLAFTCTALYTVFTVPPGNHAAAPAGTELV